MIEILSTLRKSIAESLSIVVIDDDPWVLSAIKQAFLDLPIKTNYFTDPIEGLAFCRKSEPAVVVSDNLMPGLKGIDLFKQLRGSQPLTRRVMLTGHTDQQEAITALNENTLHFYLEKPWSKQGLISVVGQQCEIYQARILNKKLDEIKYLNLKKQDQELQKYKSEIAEIQTRLQIALETKEGETFFKEKQMTRLSFAVVEPNTELRQELVAALRQQGVEEVQAYGEGKAFYSQLTKDEPAEVVVMEVDTPGIDGLGLLEQIRSKKNLLFSPLVLMTSKSAEKSLVVRAIAAHADGFLVKPFGVQKLLDEISQMLRTRATQAHPQGIHNIRKLNYLILSANSTRRLQLGKSLSEVGIEKYIYATDGMKGQPLLSTEKIDLVFYDHSLQKPNATEFAVIAKDTAERPVPVVVLGPVPKPFRQPPKEAALYYLEPVYSVSYFKELLITVVTEQLDFFDQNSVRSTS